MNAKELLQCAPRLSESNRAYIIINNGERGIIVPPGEDMTRYVCASWTPMATQSAQSRRYQPPSFAWKSSQHPSHLSASRRGA